MSTRFRRFYPDIGKRRWDELHSRSIIQEVDYASEYLDDEDSILNEFAQVELKKAKGIVEILISHLILISVCRDKRSRDHWIGEVKGFIQDFRDAVDIDNFGDHGNTNIQNRIAEKLGEIYDRAMLKVFEEVADSIIKGRYGDFFDYDTVIPSVLLNALRKYGMSDGKVRILDSTLSKFKECLGIPAESPWTLVDILSVKLPEDFESENSRAQRFDLLSKKARGREGRMFKGVADEFERCSQREEMEAYDNFRHSLQKNVLDLFQKRD